MKTLTLTVALVLAGSPLAATEFQQSFGGPEFDRGIFAAPTGDGGYAVVGATRSQGAGQEDVYLVKTDDEGRMEWSRTFGGPANDFGWTVLAIPDGYIIAGSTESLGDGEHDFYLVKTDLSGDEQWSRTFGGSGNDRCWSLIQPQAGGFLLAGETTSEGEGEHDCWLVRTDDQGNELWSRTFGGAKGDRAFAVAETEDGGFMMAGQTFSQGAGDRDAFVVRTDSLGALQWSRTFGGPATDVAHGITPTRDGAFLVTGYTTSFAEGGDDPYLVKIDAAGDTLWTRVIPLDGNNHTLTGAEAENGGFFLAGFSAFPGIAPTAALLVHTDREGRLSWHRNIQASNVGESFGYTVQATGDGGCVFAGHASVDHPKNLDMLLVKVAEDREVEGGE